MRSAFRHGDAETFEVNLAQSALGQTGVVEYAPALLIVAGKMFGTGGKPCGLYAAYDCRGGLPRQQRVLRKYSKFLPQRGLRCMFIPGASSMCEPFARISSPRSA